MSRIKRRRRVKCKLACEVLHSRGRTIPGRIVTLSEGGLALITKLGFDQGDSIQLRITPETGGKPIRVSAIVWNDTNSGASGTSMRLRRLGCVISEPSRAFLELLDRLCPAGPEPTIVPIAKPIERDVTAEAVEADLPRSRELQPPPKREPEESLPYFRVRMKQIGGPRTRILTLRARSGSHAETLAHDELARICKDAEGWGVLHIAKVKRRN